MCAHTKELEESEKRAYTYDEAVDLSGHGNYNLLCFLACCVIIIAVAVDMFGISIIIAAAKCDLQLDMMEAGLLVSAPLGGLLFAFPWGFFADTKGRRLALLISTSVGGMIGFISSFSPTWEIMFVLKFIGCSFSAAAFTLTMTFLGECTDQRHRNLYLSLLNSCNLSADIVEFGLAYFILPLTFNVSITKTFNFRSWRLLSMAMSLPLGVGALLMIPLQESPKFLANKGETDKALEVLKKIYIMNGGKGEYPAIPKEKKSLSLIPPSTISYPASAPSELVKIILNKPVEAMKSLTFCDTLAKQTVPIFKPPLLWRTLQLFYLITICCSTNNVFIMWYPKMVNSFFTTFAEGRSLELSFCERVISNITLNDGELVCDDNVSKNTIYSGIIYGVFFMCLNSLVAIASKWRRTSLMSIFAASAISGILVNVVKQPVVNIIAFILLQGTAMGIGVTAAYFVDLYDTTHRGLVASLGLMIARFGSVAGINVVGAVVIDYCEETFYFWVVFIVSGIVVVMFLPSESEMKKRISG